MGASLHFNSIVDEARAMYEPQLQSLHRQRRALAEAGQHAEVERVLDVIADIYALIYRDGVYRDPYNRHGLLPQFDLDWCHDVGKLLLDPDDQLSPDNARRFLQLLQEREPIFEARLQHIRRGKTNLGPHEARALRQRYSELKGFLQQAIDTNEAIACSL